MPIKIKREDCLKQYKSLPYSMNDEGDWFFPAVYATYHLTGISYGEELIKLMALLGADHFIFLPVYQQDALLVNKSELPAFVLREELSWDDIYFIDPAENILAAFCDHGNIHLSTRNERTDQLLHAFMSGSQLSFTNCR
jgi:hypothetical protein